MEKIPMQSSSGDLGTRASEKSLQSTSAGKAPTMAQAFNSHVPDIGKAVSHLKGMKGKMSDMGDCY